MRPAAHQAVAVFAAAAVEDDPGGRCYLITHGVSGRRLRLPRSQVQLAPRRVVIPAWLARRVLTDEEMRS
jgi:hypothetical protein